MTAATAPASRVIGEAFIVPPFPATACCGRLATRLARPAKGAGSRPVRTGLRWPEHDTGSEGWMEFRLLGPLEVRRDDGPLPVRGPKHRALLALLLLHAHETLSH